VERRLLDRRPNCAALADISTNPGYLKLDQALLKTRPGPFCGTKNELNSFIKTTALPDGFVCILDRARGSINKAYMATF
jgi:hypothetical protein